MSQGTGEKTEKATPKRKKDERERGNVLKSHDFSTAIQLLGLILMLKVTAPKISSGLQGILQETLSGRASSSQQLTIQSTRALYSEMMFKALSTIAPIFAFAIAAGILVNVVQTGFLITGKTLAVKPERINPLQGFKRLFSSRSVAEVVKSLAKIIIVIVAIYQEFLTDTQNMASLLNYPLPAACAMMASLCTSLALRCGIVLILLAVFDYLYQWWQREKELKMTKQEVKEEYKMSEGNPQTKGRIRQIQRLMATRRMMQDVPSADVVITNPTHFAIALRYEAGKDAAPVVLAKGKDLIAVKIKEIAREKGIVMVENRPLAHSLFAMTEVGRQIPSDLFEGVAEVLAYVVRLKEVNKR